MSCRPLEARPRPLFWSACLLAVVLPGLGGCFGKSSQPDAGQVAAEVNGQDISVHQVQAVLQRQPLQASELGSQASARALDGLIEQELAAQAAREAGLDKSPAVLQAMALAEREVLARAFQDGLAEKAVMPDSGAVYRYYDDHPELFARRKRYHLQEILVEGPPEQVKHLKDRLGAVKDAEAARSMVADSGLAASRREVEQWSEGLPATLVRQLVDLQPGQTLTLPQPKGLVVISVLSAHEAPVSQPQVAAQIQSVLLNERRKALVDKGMATLREQARIERRDRPASAASAP